MNMTRPAEIEAGKESKLLHRGSGKTEASSLDAVARLRANLNHAFELLAADLPRVSLEVSTIITTLQAGREHRHSDHYHHLTASRAALEQELHDAARWIRKSQKRLDGVLGDLRPGVEQLRRALTEVRSGALQLRILALNASLVARRSGEGMLGFAATTKELTQIAAEQLRESSQVIEIVDGVNRYFGQLEDIGLTLMHQVEAIGMARTDESLSGVVATYSVLEARLSEVTERCQAVAREIGRTMIAIQRQDILRQGLDHVELIAQELVARERAFASPDLDVAEQLLVAEVERRGGNLCANLLTDVQRETQQFLDEIESYLMQLTDMADFVDQVTGEAVASDLQARMGALRGAALELEQSLMGSAWVRADEVTVLSALNEIVQKLPSRLRQFAERQEQVRTLGILIRRQNARCDGIGEAKAVGEALDQLLQGEGGAWSVLDDIEEFRARIRELARSDMAGVDVRNSGITQRLADLDNAARGVSLHAESMMQAARRAVGKTGDVTRQVLREIAILKSELTAHAQVIEEFRTISKRGSALVMQLGGSEPATVELPARLGELIDRFTIFSHKQLARGDEGYETPVCDDVGSVTLF